MQNKSDLGEGKNETIIACGESRQLPVYRIAARDLEPKIDELRRSGITEFALNLTAEGEAKLSKDLVLHGGVVIAGQLPHGWMGMTEPPVQVPTKVHLNSKHILIQPTSGGVGEVCLQDLHLRDGKVQLILGFTHVCRNQIDCLMCGLCAQGARGGAVQVVGSKSGKVHLKAARCIFEKCTAEIGVSVYII